MTVDLTLAKAQTRVTSSDEDALLTHYIASSQAWLERYTGLSFAEAEFTDRFVAFGDFLELSRGPVIELTNIGYFDAAGDPQDLAGATVNDGKVYAPTAGWPTIASNSTIDVIYTAGFDVYNPLPEELTQAQLLLISHWFDNRGAVAVGVTGTPTELPYAVEALAGPFRLPTLR